MSSDKHGVQGLRRSLWRRPAPDLDGRDLPGRMHAGVGASGDSEPVPLREDGFERVAQHSFDRAEARLARPAVERGAVVLERELEVHDVTSWRAHVDRSALRPVQPGLPSLDTRDVRAHARGEPGAPPARPRRRDADLVRHALRRCRRTADGQRALRARPGARAHSRGDRRTRGTDPVRARRAGQREPAVEGRGRPSPPPPAGHEGVHPADGRAAPAAHPGDRRRAHRSRRRPREHGARRRLRVPVADHRHRRAPRHPGARISSASASGRTRSCSLR